MFLGTGCGRSGTLWLATVFTRMGHQCFHETQFGPEGPRPMKISEVSWLAVPHLADVPPSVPVVHLMRDPYKVVRSVMYMQFLTEPDGTPFDRYVRRHLPFVCEGADKLTRAIRWTALWDAPVAGRADRVLHVDRTDSSALAAFYEEMTGSAPRMDRIASVGDRVNGRTKGAEPTRDMIDAHPEGWRIREKAETWGYA